MLSGAATDVMHLKRLKDTRKASGQCASVEVTSGNAAFDTKLDNGFAKMIADLKQRETTTGGVSGQVSDTANDDKQVAAAAASLSVSSNPATDQKIQATDSKAEGMDAPSPASLSSSGPPADLSQPALEVAIVRVSYRNNTAPSSLPRIPPQKSFSLSPPLFDEDNGNSNDSSVIVLVPTTTALKAPHKPAAAQATPQVTPAAIRKRTPPTMRERIAQPKKRVKVNSNDMPSSIVAPWACSCCTFLNKKRKGSRAKCQMCENPRECPS